MFNDTLLAPIYKKILVKDSKGHCKKEAMKHTSPSAFSAISKQPSRSLSELVLAKKVGAVGIGALDHLSIQWDVAFGAVLKAWLGANHYLNYSNPEAFSMTTNWDLLFSLVATEGKLVLISFTGSIIGSPAQIEEMLAFAAEKGVNSIVEVLPMSDAALHNVDNMGTIDMIQ
ncbi:hypothetical protein Ae201684P_007084 [Aphanomyces euteiches]|nr:hypothetical protein Ae201684P_007084 [Aphanomyces euteiches]